MSDWKNITINESQIETHSAKSVLIKVPGSDFKFWHPSKLVRVKGGQYEFGYTDQFTFHLFKNGSGRHNRFEKIAERDASAEEIEELFAGNISAGGRAHKNDLPVIEINEPEYRKPEEGEVDDEFRI